MTLSNQKQALRTQMRELRRAVDDNARVAAAEAVAGLFMQHFGAFSHVALYWPAGAELDTRPLLSALEAKGVQCLLPAGDYEFRRFEGEARLKPSEDGRYMEPQGQSVVPDCIVVPLVAVDENGARVGQGGGWYDRAIAKARHQHKVLVVGVCFDAQLTPVLPQETHDELLDAVVTEKQVLSFSRAPL